MSSIKISHYFISAAWPSYSFPVLFAGSVLTPVFAR
jgi:hypothetical protein